MHSLFHSIVHVIMPPVYMNLLSVDKVQVRASHVAVTMSSHRAGCKGDFVKWGRGGEDCSWFLPKSKNNMETMPTGYIAMRDQVVFMTQLQNTNQRGG